MPIANGKTVIVKYFPNGKQDKDNFHIAAEATLLKIYKNIDGKLDYHLGCIKELLFEPEKYIPGGVVPDVVNNCDELWSVENPKTLKAQKRFSPY